MTSAIYTGTVVHQRFRPKPHHLRYRVFCLSLDLDELDGLSQRLTLFKRNRFGIFSFHDADHGALDSEASLKDWVYGHVRSLGHDTAGLKVEILCYPRLFGYVFNPLTVYYCGDAKGQLVAILYEVCNTFKERHTYVIPCLGQGETVRQSCPKAFYVSPFLPPEGDYHFKLTPPAERVSVHITETLPEGKVLFAGFDGTRVPLSDKALLKMLLTYPLMTLKVTVAIHFEALRLLLKGLRVYSHTPAKHRVASSLSGVAAGGD
ncbi:DUF1365 domain-containing protein [Asticcacaulis tiandongensis]|uniref:DUF1365 domain-containing protein n=1 Tax=Asticcacaulis tiandongensis TaxID=2565365 RepID=UPI0011285926|nr:DUF1365 domain-containing protein [Asticcacaulis tiandongensis]